MAAQAGRRGLALRSFRAGPYARCVRPDGRGYGSRPRARGPARPSAEAVTSANLMGEVLARVGGSGRALEFRVFECYTRAVGAGLARRTRPERLAGTTLIVRVTSAALAHELTLLRGEILVRMAAEIGAETVTEIRTRVGALSDPPPAGRTT